MPFSVAELKQKASSAKQASVNTFQNTKDHFQSTPSKKATWGPDALTSTQASQGSAPPPIARNNRPVPPSRRRPAGINGSEDSTIVDIPSIDWANLSQKDKEAFFSWLDEFFARFFNNSSQSKDERHTAKQPANKSPLPASFPPQPSRGPPPTIAKWSKPKLSSTDTPAMVRSINTGSNGLVMSHPPSTTHGSAALDLAHYFQPSTHWDTAWYSSDNLLPPPLDGNQHLSHAGSWQSIGSKKTVNGGVIFSDLSMCWFIVEFSTASSAGPNDIIAVKRKAMYLACPSPMSKAALIEAHETYGDTIAAFAENFVGTGEFCARGECWDLANESLKYFDSFDYVPKPVPSLNRTHGHLIFEGKATGKGKMVGRWRGGDDRVRRGDIVEWRRVKINIVGAPPNSWALLGDPDHTSIIVRDSQPSRAPADGQAMSPADLKSLEVVEQSVHSPPDRKTYDLGAFEQGEMWIYRPIGMQAYLGALLGAKCPSGVATLEI